ncbi:prenyl cysteine carboxyl methyltransferas-like protein Ste14 [Pleomassaria siparia CBS 279.74]|uniref:Protein-S-isoprenylcysteine O-methyltransferase n=1 Tax=Pleomassaria siparia CBS 279.74 TaxID=1314801 RepID=A0A6G1KQ76_9PLEO|nr:prenyl cysteine carboxyl methyltransferas-like protein Ste14 [Pleomassaria siparia CBS 279.74]
MADTQNGIPLSSRPTTSRSVFPLAEKEKTAPASDAKLRNRFDALSRAFFPGGDRSLSGIALRAFFLGNGVVFGLLSSIILVSYESRMWRPFFFIGTLCIFHFLEFYTTAEYNTPTAYVSSFLLTNGSRYRQAHTVALIETLVTSYFLPGWQARLNPPPIVALGILMIVVGQAVRSLAMAQAGTNFNHQVQSEKNDGHELVTTGLYTYLRHPSYFGFFWWGLGTQVALGNAVSFVGYAGALWYFFNHRIQHEEKHLIQFFGNDYKAYKARTRVWIPFIR